MTGRHRFRTVHGMTTLASTRGGLVTDDGARSAPVRQPAEHPSPEPAVSVRGLRMHYGPREVVRGIDLTVARGEIFAFLGPNGAGKTTTVEILEGFRRRSAGEVAVLGADPARAGGAWRARVGVVLQSSTPEPELTVRETLELYAGFYEHPRPVDEVLALVGLEPESRIRNERLSGGQRRRLDVALALVGDPEIVFLDEPTTGFDPGARRAAWEVIAGLRDLGTTVFLTTHYLEEAEALADHIAVITDGRIVAEGTPATLGGRDRMPSTITFAVGRPLPAVRLPERLAGHMEEGDDGRYALQSTDTTADLLVLTSWALDHGVVLDRLEVKLPSLEDTYLGIIETGIA